MKGFLLDLLSMARSKGIVMVCALAQGIIFARWLGPRQVGVLAGLMVYPTLIMSIGALGLQQSTTYFLGKGLREIGELKRAIVQAWLLSSSVSLAASYLLIRHVSSFGDSLLLVGLAIAPVPFTLFNRYNGGLFLGQNDIPGYNRINWIPALLGLAAAAVLVIGLGTGLPGAMLATLVGPVVMSLVLAARHDFLRHISVQIDWSLLRQLLSLGFVYATALMVINLNYRLDVVILDQLSTDYEIGIYSKAVSPVEYLWQVPMLLSTIIFARSATTRDDRRFSRNVQQLLRLSLLAIGMASLLLVLLAEQIITLLYGDAFLPSASVLVVLVPGVVLLTVFKVLNMDLAGKGKPWVSMIAMLPALAINVVLNILWVPSHGAWGAALASTVSYTAAALFFLALYARVVEVPVQSILRYRRSDFAPFGRILALWAPPSS